MISPEWGGIVVTFATLGGGGLLYMGRNGRTIEDLEKSDGEQWKKINQILNDQMESQRDMYEFKLEMERRNSQVHIDMSKLDGKLEMVLRGVEDLKRAMNCPINQDVEK